MYPDFSWCAMSLVLAAIMNLGRILLRLWPQIALLVSFAGFVLWNGGVVLGE
jgi:alpha-1,2-glucosyltransferase